MSDYRDIMSQSSSRRSGFSDDSIGTQALGQTHKDEIGLLPRKLFLCD